MRELLNSQDDENGIARQPAASDVRDKARTALSQLAQQRTPWRRRMPFAEPADAPSYHEPGAAKAIGGARLSKATGYAPGVVPKL